jgi:hypothetical protein
VARLSFVSGTVAVKLTGSDHWQAATVNTPFQQDFELATSRASYAEVEFRGGSTARFGELTQAKLNELGSGNLRAVVNGMEVERGYATFCLLANSSDAFRIKIGDAILTAQGNIEFRTDIDGSRYRLEAFHGSVAVAAGALKADLGGGKVLERQSGSTEAAFNIRSGITADDWDKWVEARDEQAERTAKDQYLLDPHGPFYGWNDLNTYGEWVEFSPHMFGWMPYAPAAWQPYAQGHWENHPGLGWTWISSEPWGWLPYHCGGWRPPHRAFGWVWMLPNEGCDSWVPSAPALTPGAHHRSAYSDNDSAPQTVAIPATMPESGLDFASRRSSAPPTILMDGDPQMEKTLLSGYRVHAASEPLRYREGTTLGGVYSVRAGQGEFRGEFFMDSAYTRPPGEKAAADYPNLIWPYGNPPSHDSKQTLPIGLWPRPPVVSHLRGTTQAPLYPDGWLCGPCTRHASPDRTPSPAPNFIRIGP